MILTSSHASSSILMPVLRRKNPIYNLFDLSKRIRLPNQKSYRIKCKMCKKFTIDHLHKAVKHVEKCKGKIKHRSITITDYLENDADKNSIISYLKDFVHFLLMKRIGD